MSRKRATSVVSAPTSALTSAPASPASRMPEHHEITAKHPADTTQQIIHVITFDSQSLARLRAILSEKGFTDINVVSIP